MITYLNLIVMSLSYLLWLNLVVLIMAQAKYLFCLFLIILGIEVSWQLPSGSSRISGGSSISIEDAPYIASVEFMGRFSCPAVIIAPKWVASSAICMDLLAPEDAVVRTGATEYETGGHLWPVEDIIMHPNLSTSDQYAADLCLIQLSLDIVENNSTKIITIADKEPAPGTLARVSGWGAIAPGNIMHRALLSAELPILDRTKCNEYYEFEVNSLRLCTLKEGSGPCDDDDGDPLVVNNQLVGIKSWILPEQCGSIDRPSPYVNLANPVFRDFIRTTTGV